MDPIGLALDFIEIIKVLQQTFEKIKDAPKAFEDIVSQANKVNGVLLRLTSLGALLSEDQKRYLADQIDYKDCKQTICELSELVERIRPGAKAAIEHGSSKGKVNETPMTLKQKVYWFLKESDAKQLGQRMDTQAQRIANATDAIHFELGIHMGQEITSIRETLIAQFQPIIAVRGTSFAQLGAVHIWHGQIQYKPGEGDHMAYFRDRRRLSDAAYYGKWQQALEFISQGKRLYNQSWVNCLYIAPADSRKPPSGYTALHQAAWHGASAETVEKLIKLGASRLARTVRNGEHQTPLEIARKYGWTHLYDLLSPVITHPVNFPTLQRLQDQLHHLIRRVFDDPGDPNCSQSIHLDRFRLPELEILTELQSPQMWFPLQPECFDDKEPVGVHLWLDRKELVVKLQKSKGEAQLFRIREDACFEIEQGIILHPS